jgi:mono/diheme cytochrome c family protein
LIAAVAVGAGCRYDMQDQPRLKPFKQSDFYADKRGSRDLPAGTVARGHLKADKALYTGKVDNPDAAAVAQTATDSSGRAVMTTFPNAVTEFPIPVDRAVVDRGEQRYKVFCSVCHGPLGDGNGMIPRRGFIKPPTFHDDRLRNAPVGHYFDVITNGLGNMSGYASQIPVTDRWAIVAYIRALQLTQNESAAAPAAGADGAKPNGGTK